MQFILDNWQTFLLLLIVLVVVVYMVVTKQWDKLRKMAYDAILLAENTIKGSKMGQERFAQVLNYLYDELIPPWLKPFVTEEMLKHKLQSWFDEVKDLLDNGKKDGSITPGNVDQPPDNKNPEQT